MSGKSLHLIMEEKSRACLVWSSRVSARQLLHVGLSRMKLVQGQDVSLLHIWPKPRPTNASYRDSAHPVGLEFWLPGKISVLGERGLSFACSLPSCNDAKGPLSTSPVYREHLHGDQLLRVLVFWRSSTFQFQEWFIQVS